MSLENEPYGDSFCPLCNNYLNADLLAKRRDRGNMLGGLCRTCWNAGGDRTERRIVYKATGFVCYPWLGDFDYDLMQPMLDGVAVCVGARICGHADCVNEDHVIVKVPGTWRKSVRKSNRPKVRV